MAQPVLAPAPVPPEIRTRPPLLPVRPGRPPARRRAAAGRAAARLLLLGLAAGILPAAFAAQKPVTLDLEGQISHLRTYAPTARSLLARRGIRVGRLDLIRPSGRLRSGDRVTFRRAKRVRLVLDGRPRLVVARGVTVGEVLSDLGLAPDARDHVYPALDARLTPRTTIYLRNAIHAVVRVDGVRRDVVSSADTVANLLAQAGIEVGRADLVYPSPETEPREGMWIRVIRVRSIVETRSVSVPFRYVRRYDSSLPSGERRVVQEGSEGLVLERYAVRLEDGRPVSSRLVERRVVRHARDYIVLIGTREPDFRSTGRFEEGRASWFRADGLVAAHRTLPFGTTVRVTDLDNGRSVVVRITERGPYVDGRIIDLSDEAFSRLASLGTGTIRVRIEY